MERKTVKVFAMHCSADKVYKGRIEELENTLKALQCFVGGHIQIVSLTDGIDIVTNEEGKIDGLPYNRVWGDDDGIVLDIFVGNILACRHDEDGSIASILEGDIPVILKRLPAFVGIQGRSIQVRREEDLSEYEKSEL